MRAIPTKPIEAIEPDLRREGCVRVVIGGRIALIVPADAARAAGIEIGSVLRAEVVHRLELAADEDAAYRTATRLLEGRPFARKDLARRLALKGHPLEVIEAALDRAQHFGYLDDVRFATYYVESRSARGRGPTRLRRELARLGVARDLIDAALASAAEEPAAAQARIRKLLARRMPQLAGLSRPSARRRLLAYLARRGYTGETARRVVAEEIGSS